jgi:hypothetical protein
VLGAFRKLFGGGDAPSSDKSPVREPAPSEVKLDGQPSFSITDHLAFEHGFPFPDWKAVGQWLDALPSEEIKARGWDACERGWLLHLRDALGPSYRLDEVEGAVLVSSLEAGPARAALEFMQRTSNRIAKVLDGIAESPEWGSDVLVVFDERDAYYRYVSHYYPNDGEFSLSGGMCLNQGCVHFVTVKNDLQSVEHVIAHELTHSMLSHLPLPVWLNEGLAVNTEHRLCPQRGDYEKQRELVVKHATFWGEAEIQEFWSGASFYRPDDGNALSYDLAQAMVRDLSRDWDTFRRFVTAANMEDGGYAAAQEHLSLDLGTYVANLLGRPEAANLAPAPSQWPEQV